MAWLSHMITVGLQSSDKNGWRYFFKNQDNSCKIISLFRDKIEYKN